VPISGKQGQRQGPVPILVEDFNRSTPTFALVVVDLSKVKNLPLDKLATTATAILDDVPVTMLFAVLESRVALQKHYCHRFYAQRSCWEETRSVLELFLAERSFI